MEWIYLIACLSWGLTTALMLYVKLRKKTDSIPVLALICCFLVYMNSGDLFAKTKTYTVAIANRKLLAPQFFVSLVFAFMLASYRELMAIGLITATVAYSTIGWRTVPFLGVFLGPKKHGKNILLEIAAQCMGLVVGTLLSIAMIDSGPQPVLPQYTAGSFDLVSTLLLVSLLVSKNSELFQTLFGSAFVASVSRSIEFYHSPLILVVVLAGMRRWFPKAVISVAQLVRRPNRFSLLLVHSIGPLLLTFFVFPPSADVEYVSKLAIAQEFFFSVLIGFLQEGPYELIACGAWLATANSFGMVHLVSAISLGSSGLNQGRLLARLIWQLAGSMLGATLVRSFVDSLRIDFAHLTDVIRTTDGQRIVKQ